VARDDDRLGPEDGASALIRAQLSRRAVLRGAGAALALAGMGPVLAACGEPSGTRTVSFTRDRLIIAQGSDATTMDINFQSDSVTSSILWNMFDPLLQRGPDMKSRPGLALSATNVDDRTWELKLRPNVRFQNGEELTAEAVAFSIERSGDRKRSRQFSRVSAIAGVTPVDPLTVRITTTAPYAPLPAILLDVAIVPPKYARERGDAGFNERPVGSGPYKFIEWKRDDHVAMEAYDGYWGPKASIKRVEFRPIKEDSSRLAALKTGSVDVITNVPPDQVAALNRNQSYEVRRVPSDRVIYMAFQTFKPPFDKVEVRQALNHAVDVDAIIKDLLLGLATRTPAPVTKEYVGFDPSIKPYPHDINKAKQLLAAAGYPNGIETVINTPAGRFIKDKEVAEALAGQLAKAGVRARVIPDDFSIFLDKYHAKKFEGLYINSWGNASFDADYTLFPLFHSKGRGYYYKNAELDRAIDRGRSVFDPKKRQEAYNDALRIIREDAPWVFLYQQQDLYGVHRGIHWQPRSDEAILAVEMSPRT
jgi:peptide/nickel transport system substrate-binding protein